MERLGKLRRWFALEITEQDTEASRRQLTWVALLVAAAFAVGAAVLCLVLSSQLRPEILTRLLFNVWFEADIARVVEVLTDRKIGYRRTSIHPLFNFFVATPTIGMIKLFGIAPMMAIKVGMAAVAALVTAALFILLRFVTRRTLDAAIYTALFLSSATFMFWFSVPETYTWGALSILAPILFVAVVPYGQWPIGCVAVSAFSSSMTITNWMAGLVATAVSYPRNNALRLSIYSFALLALLSALQSNYYPYAGPFLRVVQERKYISAHKSATQVPTAVASFAAHSIVLPELSVGPQIYPERPDHLSVQTLAVGSGGVPGLVGVVAWVCLLSIGIWGITRREARGRLRLILGGLVLGQLLLHVLYGAETFLFAAHYAPLLIAVAAYASLTPARWPALGLAVVVSIAGGINNAARFDEARAYVDAVAGMYEASAEAVFRESNSTVRSDDWRWDGKTLTVEVAGDPAPALTPDVEVHTSFDAWGRAGT